MPDGAERSEEGFEDLRVLAPRVLGALVRRYGHFDLAEDAVQEAMLAATVQWPAQGRPDDPRAWLITVASRRLTDLLRAEQSRHRREEAARPVPTGPIPDSDDSLILLFLCCHPSLSTASQIALTLRAVGGLTTAEIARAFLVPEGTMTRRITRSKERIKAGGIPFALPPDHTDRLAAVLHVLYLIFTEGYASLPRNDLSQEAIRLTRLLVRLLPGDGEAAGLLALELLTDARRPARLSPDGSLVPMESQDRSLWNASLIAEGTAILTKVLPRQKPGPYQIQAAIAALHDEAPSAAETDWPQILALYEILLRLSDNPVVALNHAVAVTMVRGPEDGLNLLQALENDARLKSDHRLPAARAHLFEMAGDTASARAAYETAAAMSPSLAQQRYLRSRAAGLPSPEKW
ncbi:RNA polymerase sigma factor [Amycolatopsis sp. cg5]|uniref:RNA polymerase sigma factor n=1 Tax=Amycolatopsis sp. cg5 TaxID=3238802 RepID=UPI003526AC17